MSERSLLARLVPVRLRPSNVDLIAVTALTLLAVVVIRLPLFSETIVQFGVGLLFLLFAPGYALVSALFPNDMRPAAVADDTTAGSAGSDSTADSTTADAEMTTADAETTNADGGSTGMLPGRLYTGTGIDGVDRAALGFGSSVAVVPLIGIAVSLTPWGLGVDSTVAAVAGFTLCAVGVAGYRRRQLPAARRFGVPYRAWIAGGRRRVFSPDSRVDALLTVVLAISVLVAFGSVAVAVAEPPDGEQYSEFYLLTEDTSGELVADGYPTTLVADEPEPVVVGVENYEGATTEYTVVVELQAVEIRDDNTVDVVDRERIETFEPTLDDGEQWQTEHDLVATMTGEELRLSYLLYTDEPPATASTETADQSLHLWVDVEEPEIVVE